MQCKLVRNLAISKSAIFRTVDEGKKKKKEKKKKKKKNKKKRN